MGINDGATRPIHELEAGEGDLDEIWPTKDDSYKMFGRSFGGAGNGIRSHHPPVMTLVVLQDGIRFRRQSIAVASVRIIIDGHHIRPFFEVGLILRSKFMLVVLRPAREIADTFEAKGRSICAEEAESSQQRNRRR